MTGKEIYQYQRIMLHDEHQSTIPPFKPNTRIVQSIRQIEKELRQQQILYDEQNRRLRNIINIRGSSNHQQQKRLKCRHLTSLTTANNNRQLTTDNYRRNHYHYQSMTMTKEIPRQSRKHRHANDVYCRILGPSYCHQCNFATKIKDNQDNIEAYLNDKRETEGKVENGGRLTSREKGVYALLPTGSFHKGNHQPGLEYVKKYVEDLQQYRAMPLLSSDETLRDSFHRAMLIREKVIAADDKKVSAITPRKGTDSDEQEHLSETSNSMLGTRKKIRKPVTPPNSLLASPSDNEGGSRQNTRDAYSPYVARTDLELFHDITRERKEKHMQTRKHGNIGNGHNHNKPLDVIELATKLSVLFRERYLPPERSFSRISTASSVDHDHTEPLPRSLLLSRGDHTSQEEKRGESPSLKHQQPEDITVKSPLHRRSATRQSSSISSLKTVKEYDPTTTPLRSPTTVTKRRIKFNNSDSSPGVHQQQLVLEPTKPESRLKEPDSKIEETEYSDYKNGK